MREREAHRQQCEERGQAEDGDAAAAAPRVEAEGRGEQRDDVDQVALAEPAGHGRADEDGLGDHGGAEQDGEPGERLLRDRLRPRQPVHERHERSRQKHDARHEYDEQQVQTELVGDGSGGRVQVEHAVVGAEQALRPGGERGDDREREPDRQQAALRDEAAQVEAYDDQPGNEDDRCEHDEL